MTEHGHPAEEPGDPSDVPSGEPVDGGRVDGPTSARADSDAALFPELAGRFEAGTAEDADSDRKLFWWELAVILVLAALLAARQIWLT
ncbi:hypothetical protein SAMN04487904_101243 [Actinopolyspora lacussalsi subsp. righensis]|uniref:Uncharacterized protein n=1 Tax=Actinopolyspora righensis TaxID=995060 RepID=A0A1I6X5X1_9ACTN|nr:hypothetical protein [Actinopolyspora righensis]SFT33798.1 hypothetical protein SAMN04487904_101243 [Actinopolyspora righensis]